MTSNKALHMASLAQQDEFYTQYRDVEEELGHYWDHFRGAKILCNCDDPFESSFFRYFALQFAYLGIGKLTAMCYAGSPIANAQLELKFDDSTPALHLTGAGIHSPAGAVQQEVPRRRQHQRHNLQKRFPLFMQNKTLAGYIHIRRL